MALLILLDPTPPGKSTTPLQSAASRIGTEKIARYRAEISRHWSKLSLLSPREKLTYIRERIIGQMANRAATINNMSKKIISKVYVGIGHPLPPRLRRFYLRGIHKRALQNYVPKTYSGHVVLFRGGQSDREWRSIWSSLIHGKLEIYEVPGAHGSFIREPNVQVWAKTLKDCLEREQPISKEASPGNAAICECIDRSINEVPTLNKTHTAITRNPDSL